jgi:4-amino-4-deoxy-L-arabinose transferase-like glycosyltransferase
VKELSGDDLVATLTFLILLFSKLFLMFAREARTDQGLLLGIFAALFFFIKGWKDRRYLFWIFPAIAVGFMFKSVVAFLAFPTILIYAAFYNQWSWIKDKYLWAGAAFSLALLVPWHLLETIRFGMVFWDNYLGVQIFQRATTTLTGTDNPYDYIVLLILNYKPWLLILLIESVLVLSVSLSKRLRARIHFSHLLPPLLTGVFIVTVFSLAKTHLPTYILPALPFFAMYIAFSYQYLLNLISRSSVRIFTIAVSALFVSSYIFSSVASALDQVTSVTYEEQSLGQIYKNNPPGTLYSFGWPVLSTINYYSATSARYLDASTEGGKLLKAPLYFIVQASTAPQGLKVLYRGNSLMLLYSDHDIQLPSL